MEKNEEFIIAAVVFFGLSIWLYAKLKSERKQKDKLSKDYTKLVADHAVLEADQLKFQLEPHTLKNTLAKLNLASKKLHKGMDSLTALMDYILYQGKKHFVSIENEIEFIEQYLKLNEIFINEINNIQITKNFNPSSPLITKPCVPHLVTAYFLENAFKHGSPDHPQFLKIHIELVDNRFMYRITNRISEGREKPTNGGLGLTNMKKRMELFYSGKYSILTEESNDFFTSTLIINL